MIRARSAAVGTFPYTRALGVREVGPTRYAVLLHGEEQKWTAYVEWDREVCRFVVREIASYHAFWTAGYARP